MYLGRGTRIALRIVTGVILAVAYVPLIVVMVNSFNADRTFGWPPSGFTLTWWSRALHNAGALAALRTSVLVGLFATAIALWMLTVVVAHATFCIVVVFNNVIARLRRLGGDLEEASMDLGADSFTTFRRVTFPLLRTALLAGGLLAFALSFDEIIVTRFTAGQSTTTLPIWILDNLFRPSQAPIVNVVATVLVIASIIPIWIAQRLSGNASGGRL
jgi:putative spermidine/putrescine transport system permease protein